MVYTVCPTRYRIRHLFNNFTTNEDIVALRTTDTHYSHTLQTHTTDTFLLISYTTNVLFIGVRITSIKEMPGSVASGTHCIYRVSQEERTKLRESVPYVKLYRYKPKHLYPKLNGYGDNGKRSLKL